MIKNLFVIASLLFTSVQSKLSVYGPEDLRREFEMTGGEIQSVVANFGHIPYGQVMSGRLYYNEQNKDGCNPGQPFTQDLEGDPDGILSPFFMVDVGDCSFVQQVRNIERAGGALAIIVDNKNEDIQELILSDDGTGQGIQIPALLVNKHEGEQLKEFIKDSDPERVKTIALTAEFNLEVRQDNQVNVELWYTASDDKSLDFLRNFQNFVQPILNDINFKVRAVTTSCPHCEATWKQKNCVSDGKYCAIKHANNLHLNGREILLENLRHYCLNKFSQEIDVPGNLATQITQDMYKNLVKTPRIKTFFKYLKMAHELCRNRISQKCSRDVFQEMSADDKPDEFRDFAEDCVKKTFDGDDWNKVDNMVLRQDLKDWNNYGTHLYPAIIINGKTIRGHLTPNNIFEAVCAAFKIEPYACRQYQEKEEIPMLNYQTTGINTKTLILIMAVLVMINLIIIFLYRRYLQRELQQDMTVQVSSAVSQYVALSKHPELQTTRTDEEEGHRNQKYQTDNVEGQ